MSLFNMLRSFPKITMASTSSSDASLLVAWQLKNKNVLSLVEVKSLQVGSIMSSLPAPIVTVISPSGGLHLLRSSISKLDLITYHDRTFELSDLEDMDMC